VLGELMRIYYFCCSSEFKAEEIRRTNLHSRDQTATCKSKHDELEAKFFEERAALEAKYQKLYQPLYAKVFFSLHSYHLKFHHNLSQSLVLL